MSVFKISFSSNSVEGLASLTGIPFANGVRESVSNEASVASPPKPSVQDHDGLSSGSEKSSVSPPPLPEGTVADTNMAAEDVMAPPPMDGLGSNAMQSPDQLGPPPMPNTSEMVSNGPSSIPLPPEPTGMASVAEDAQAQTIDPPPGPPKAKGTSSKKAAKK